MTQQKIGFTSLEESDTPLFGLGEIHVDENGCVWEYCQINGALAAGYAALIPNGNDAAPLTTTNAGSIGQKVGFANCAFTDNYYGWLWRGNGDFEAIIENAHSAGAILTTTASAGIVGASGVALDGLRAIDAGVTATRVTVHTPTLLTVGVAAASD